MAGPRHVGDRAWLLSEAVRIRQDGASGASLSGVRAHVVGDQRYELQKQQADGHRGDLARVVERWTKTDGIGAHQAQAAKAVQELHDFADGQTVQFGVGHARRVGRVDRVQVEAQVGWTGADDATNLGYR